jgi:hypothetical protein
MATELPTTFSPGQKKIDNSALDDPFGNEDPTVLEFNPRPVHGISQTSPFTGLDTFSVSGTPRMTTPSQRVDPQIPTGVTVRPQLTTVLQKKGPTLQTRQLWEGTVTKVLESGFVATLRDKTEQSNPDEQALFDFNEVSLDDRRLISVGSSFYWVIGTEQTPAGQIKNVSTLRFRRLPSWTRSALEKAAVRARRIRRAIGTEE